MSSSKTLLTLGVVLSVVRAETPEHSTLVLQSSPLRHDVQKFHRNDVERNTIEIENKAAFTWLKQNVFRYLNARTPIIQSFARGKTQGIKTPVTSYSPTSTERSGYFGT